MPSSTPSPRPTERALGLEEIGRRLEQLLQVVCADEVEIVWIETRRRVASIRDADVRLPTERSIMVRVIDRGRLGIHRTASGTVAELENAVRHAVAQSRAREPLRGLPHLPAPGDDPATIEGLWDPEVAQLSRSRARTLLQRDAGRDERARLAWGSARVSVFSSRGVRRQTRVTHLDLTVSCGRREGSGTASVAARSLDALDVAEVFERARRRHAPEGPSGKPPTTDAPVLLAPECVAALCEILKRDAFSASSYQLGYSFLRSHLGDQVFDRRLDLRDDGTDPRGLPFPFDLEGTAKRPVELISGGTARTPALDQRQAAVLGLPPTGHSITGNDAQAENLFLLPGEADRRAMIAAAEGGIWIGSFDALECFEPGRMMFRARARGVRRVEGGDLGEALPDLIWEDSLLRVLSSLQAIGDRAIVCASPTLLGGTAAPALCVSGGGVLRPA
jgi:predicted Zn-dependent protease